MTRAAVDGDLDFIHAVMCLSDVQRELLHSMVNDIPRTTAMLALGDHKQTVVRAALFQLDKLGLAGADTTQSKRWAITAEGRRADAILCSRASSQSTQGGPRNLRELVRHVARIGEAW